MVFMSNSKEELHELKNEIELYLAENLNLKLKENWQIFPTNIRGIDFLGFRFFHDYTMLRGSIKKAYMKIIKSIHKKGVKIEKINSIMAYYGWIKASNSYNLLRNSISKSVIEKFNIFCEIVEIKNPINKLVLVPKSNINVHGNYQPTLF